jgi:site-specific recombinase XerD
VFLDTDFESFHKLMDVNLANFKTSIFNSYLKEVGNICDIPKEITPRITQHTFATSATLTNRLPIETVSKMLKDKNIQTTERYAKILDKKVSEDMMVLRNKFNPRKSADRTNLQKSTI